MSSSLNRVLLANPATVCLLKCSMAIWLRHSSEARPCSWPSRSTSLCGQLASLTAHEVRMPLPSAAGSRRSTWTARRLRPGVRRQASRGRARIYQRISSAPPASLARATNPCKPAFGFDLPGEISGRFQTRACKHSQAMSVIAAAHAKLLIVDEPLFQALPSCK